MTNEPEPNGWELMRGLKEVKESIDKMALLAVSQVQHAAAVLRIENLEKEVSEQKKAKAQMWLAIGITILGMVCTIVGGIVLASLTRGTP